LTPKQFQKFLARDGACYHCGDATTAVPHHRANRGMGGSKARDEASNVIVMCSNINGLMESDPIVQQMAKDFGWKLESWQQPAEVPVYSVYSGKWFTLNGYERKSYDV
jgi:hypothetical protein